jgi:hypothetical protein
MVEVDGDKADICSCYAEDFRQASIGRDPQEEWANARLIAAAPKMLAAGKHLAVKLAEVYRAAGQNPAKCQAISDWMAAVAEAEGRS